MNEIPAGFEDALSSYDVVFHDSWCGEPLAWGFKILGRLGTNRFDSLRRFGELERVEMGRWVLVTKRLTPDDARAKYGEVTKLELGPQGGF